VYSRDTIKLSTQGNVRAIVLSQLHLLLIPNALQRRLVEVNGTCDGGFATVVRVVRTPWPIVVGQTVFSYMVALEWGRKCFPKFPSRNPQPETGPSRFKQALWAINLVRVVGALIYQIIDIAESNEIIPSVGIAIALGALLSGSLQFDASIKALILRYLGISIAGLGLLLYTISGAIAWVLHSDANDSAVLIYEGQTSYSSTMGDYMVRYSWLLGAILFFLIVICPIFLPEWLRCYRLSWRGNEDKRERYFRRVQLATNYVIVAGGMAACISAIMNTLPGDVTDDNACLPGGVSGFWDVWTQDKLAVVRSLFTW